MLEKSREEILGRSN